jgi:hypothetical protein
MTEIDDSTFTTTAAEYEEEREAQSDDVWIKGFREGETKVRLLIEPLSWNSQRMHYSRKHKIGFPCLQKNTDACIGCQSNDAETRDRNRQFIVPVIDAKGNQQVFRFGSELYKKLKNRQQRYGTVLDRDFTIVRTGKGKNDTDYDLENGNKYKLELPEDFQVIDVGALLASKYLEAKAKFAEEAEPEAHEPEPGDEGQDEGDEGQSDGRIRIASPAKKAAPAKAAAPAPKPTEPAPESEAEQQEISVNGNSPDAPTEDDRTPEPRPADMTLGELRDYLEANHVDHKPRDPRSKLVRAAEEFQKTKAGF